MAARQKAESSIRKFTTETAASAKTAQAKLIVPKVALKELVPQIQDLLKEAEDGGINATHARASVTLY